MSDDDRTAPRLAFSADQILLGAVTVVLILVLIFALMLTFGARLHAQTENVVQSSRNARAHIFELLQAQNEANSAVFAYVGMGDQRYLSTYQNAAAEMRSRVSQVRQIASHDEFLARDAAEIENITLSHLNILDAWVSTPRGTGMRASDSVARGNELRDELRERLTSFHALLNQRIDTARAAEDRTRRERDLLALALVGLSLVAGVLALTALRRERQQWRLAREAADQAAKQAAESESAKSRFLAAASHDMRQPLHALSLYLVAMRRRVESEEAQGILTKMERAVQSMTSMFTGLLDLARIQANVIQPDLTVFPLQEVLTRIAAHHPGAKLTSFSTVGAELVRSDPNLLERLIGNLVSNALKYGHGAALIDVAEIDGKAEIRVVDRGPGIAPEDQKRIFDEFVRIEGQRAEGLGLGLAIVKRLADLLGAELDLKSVMGRGSTFIVRVPLADSVDGGEHLEAPRATVSLERVDTLVMDDDPLALEAMAGVLRDLGAHVRTARDGKAVDALLDEGFEPDLMVMDFRIDGALEGLDIAVRTHHRLPRTPRVVMVTGETDAKALEALRTSGYRWLIKPMTPDALLRSLAASPQARGAA